MKARSDETLTDVLVMTIIAGLMAASGIGAGTLRVSPLDGRWKATITHDGLLRTGEVDPAEARKLYGPWTAQFANGRFQTLNTRTGRGAQGTFTISGKLIRFVFATGVGIKPGAVAVCAESVYRDRLTFTKVPGRRCLAFNAAVWTRVR